MSSPTNLHKLANLSLLIQDSKRRIFFWFTADQMVRDAIKKLARRRRRRKVRRYPQFWNCLTILKCHRLNKLLIFFLSLFAMNLIFSASKRSCNMPALWKLALHCAPPCKTFLDLPLCVHAHWEHFFSSVENILKIHSKIVPFIDQNFIVFIIA